MSYHADMNVYSISLGAWAHSWINYVRKLRVRRLIKIAERSVARAHQSRKRALAALQEVNVLRARINEGKL